MIRYANECDRAFLLATDRHLPPELLTQKLAASEILLIEKDGAPIGFLRWNLFWDEIPFCNLLFVLEAHRDQGYGSALMDRWEQEMKAQGHDKLLVSTQADETAQHFYRKRGYRDIGSFVLPGETSELILYRSI